MLRSIYTRLDWSWLRLQNMLLSTDHLVLCQKNQTYLEFQLFTGMKNHWRELQTRANKLWLFSAGGLVETTLRGRFHHLVCSCEMPCGISHSTLRANGAKRHELQIRANGDMQLDRSTYEVLQILSISLTDKTHLRDLFERTKFEPPPKSPS